MINKKILITGHSGFVGSWLSVHLLKCGYKLAGISLKNNNPLHVYNKCHLDKYIQSYYFDITNYERTEKIYSLFKPDIVIHLAAQPIVLTAFKQPFYTFKTNIIGTLNILNISKKYKCNNIINFTTDKVYQKNTTKKFLENDNLFADDPYGASKVCSDLIGQTYNKTFDSLNVRTLRAGNIIGGGDYSENRLIPDYFRSIINSTTLKIRNPNHIRPWQHVASVVSLIECLIKKKNIKKNIFNLGPINKSQKVISLIESMNNFSSRNPKIKIINKPENNIENPVLKLNSSYARTIFNIKKSSFKKDVYNTISWYERSLKQNNMLDFTENQIDEYL
tara:strand:+ start:8468 stop:9469 length:1002 start_codon:yes stop_codon:yes gene_type:complete